MNQNSVTNHIAKVPLGLYPTPLQELPNMSRLLGDEKRLFLKREDLCGVGLGGNKIRRLEYLLAEALEQNCDCIVTGGGSQSNQTVATSAGGAVRHLAELLGGALHEVEGADEKT